MNEQSIPYGGSMLYEQSCSKMLTFHSDWELQNYVAQRSPIDVLLSALVDRHGMFIYDEVSINKLRALTEVVITEATAYKLSLTAQKGTT